MVMYNLDRFYTGFYTVYFNWVLIQFNTFFIQFIKTLDHLATFLCLVVGESYCKFLGKKPSSSFNYFKRMT